MPVSGHCSDFILYSVQTIFCFLYWTVVDDTGQRDLTRFDGTDIDRLALRNSYLGGRTFLIIYRVVAIMSNIERESSR